MQIKLEPKIVQNWLAPLNMDLSDLLLLSETKQAEFIRLWLPAEDAVPSFEERISFAVVGWAIGMQARDTEITKTLAYALCDLFLAIDEPTTAQQIFEIACPQPDLGSVTYYSRLIEIQAKQGHLETAKTSLAAMQEHHPTLFTTLNTAGRLNLRVGQLALALENYKAGFELMPEHPNGILGMARVLIRLDDTLEAARMLATLDDSPKLNVIHLREMVYLWQELGNPEQVSQKQALLHQKRQEKLLSLIGIKPLKTEERTLEIIEEIAAPAERLEKRAFAVLQEVFGYQSFRLGQEQVISNVLRGQDTLAILPTGAGKSLCYQLPAMLMSKPVLVISPLISLMKDQFDKLPLPLKERTLIINSSLEPYEVEMRLRELAQPDNQVRLIYAAPERLRQRSFVHALEQANLGVIVIDEAHCVAMWGNDFRPDYLFIRKALVGLKATLLAVTATATPDVAGEIGQQLGRELSIVRGSVFRSNLHFTVEKLKSGADERFERVVALCQELEGTGIVYTRSREKCEQLADFLNEKGVNAGYYHAGLNKGDRQAAQESWTANYTKVIIATVAFGMGIDKPDVRYIIHLNPPASLENYVQEAGRAGRDGADSDCILLYTSNDKGNLTRWLREEHERLNLDALRTVYRAISRRLNREKRGTIALADLVHDLTEHTLLGDETLVRVIISILERAGLLERGYDLPAMAELTLYQPIPNLANLIEVAELQVGQTTEVNLLDCAVTLNISPPQLEANLLLWASKGWLRYAPARRDLYIELREVEGDVKARLQQLLDRMQLASEERLDYLDNYLRERTCRQILLARHFGERLTNKCGVCDNCAGKTRSKAKKTLPPPVAVPSVITTILKALENLRLSRTALCRILLGSESADERGRNNPQWAILQGQFSQKELEITVDELAKQEFITVSQAEFRGHSYNALQLSDKGKAYIIQPDNDAFVLPPVITFSTKSVSSTKNVPLPIDDEVRRQILGCLALVTGNGGEAWMGRTGLTRLLMGEPSALGTRANNPYKGCLAGKYKTKQVESLIETLIKEHLIAEEIATRSSGGQYQALKLSEDGYTFLQAAAYE